MKATLPLFVLVTLAAACSSNRPAANSSGAAATPKAAAAAPTTAAATAAAPASATGAPAAAAPGEVDPNLVKQGYKASKRNGQIVYCKEQLATGTRFPSNVCLTAEQLADLQRRAREDVQRMHQNGCSGTAGCGT